MKPSKIQLGVLPHENTWSSSNTERAACPPYMITSSKIDLPDPDRLLKQVIKPYTIRDDVNEKVSSIIE